jgi:hypothetical protein
MESNRRYDIVRKESEKALFWLEGAPELSVAKSRVAELLSFWPGEYQIFDLKTKQVVFSSSTAANLWSTPVGMPVSVAAE